MRFALFALAALAPAALGWIIPRQASSPPCLQQCLAELPLNLTTCDPTDFTCLCGSQTFLNAVTQCIDSQCDTADIATAEQYAVSTCGAAGVSVSPAPIPGTSTGSSGSASSTPASSGTSSSAAPSQTGSSGALSLSPVSALGLTGLAALAGLMISL